jgi:hypothetical protein
MDKNIKKILTYFLMIMSFFSATLSAKAIGQPPVVDAGDDLYLLTRQTSVLNGSAYDADGGALTYLWNCNGGTLSNYNIDQPVYTAPDIIAFHNYGTFICALTATDSAGLSNSDSIKIYVNYDNSLNVTGINVKTAEATNISKNQATLNGSFLTKNDSVSYVWFQYGFSTNYGNETEHQAASGPSGSFYQNLSSLFLNATYHYRAVAQDSAGNKFYGQDMTFQTQMNALNDSSVISKKVINLTSGNLGWLKSVNAKPYDILSFSITIQTDKNLDNIFIKETLPSGLEYSGNLLINAMENKIANPIGGINAGSLKAGEVLVVSYQAKVNPSSNYGTINLENLTTVTADQLNQITDVATIIVNNSQVSGASTTAPTDLSTGQTNNFFADSFFLPMILIVLGGWFYFSGKVYTFADWLNKYL